MFHVIVEEAKRMWERDNLRAGISILEASLFTLIVNLFGVKRRDGQDGRRESRLVSKEIVHLKLKSDIKKLGFYAKS